MRTYRVKSIFGPTLQGEGLHAGMPCLFLRLAGCNAWDGRPETRARSACPYCDTDFLGGEALDLPAIRARLAGLAGAVPGAGAARLGLVLSGGEPLLQADRELLAALGADFAWVDIETNGTRPCPERPANVFISCSPKRIAGEEVVAEPDWWKVLIPDQQEFPRARPARRGAGLRPALLPGQRARGGALPAQPRGLPGAVLPPWLPAQPAEPQVPRPRLSAAAAGGRDCQPGVRARAMPTPASRRRWAAHMRTRSRARRSS